MNEFIDRSATEVAAAISRGEVSAHELTKLLLDRIEAAEPSLNAVVEVRRDDALAAADAADRSRAAGASLGPLHGVPMTIKEAFPVAGLRSTWGNPAFGEYRAEVDAAVVDRLRRAGAVIVGTTNVAFMLADFGQTGNPVYGTTGNPWDTARTPGGSSGGSAAALAAGLTFLEYGSDVAGSLRIPASFCGVYGLRPTPGVVPVTGFQPPHAPPTNDPAQMLVVGPLARSVADLRTALTVTAGAEHPDALAWSWRLNPPRHDRLAAFRVGVVLDHPAAPVSNEVTSVLAAVVQALAGAGARIVEGWPPDLDPARSYGSFGFHIGQFLALADPGQPFERITEFATQAQERQRARAAWARHFNDVDVFLCPTNISPAFPHDPRPFGERTIATPEGERPYDNQPFWTAHASLAGLPAVVAPAGRTPGALPVGVQIVGPRHEDDTALTFAELLADLIGGYVPPPSP